MHTTESAISEILVQLQLKLKTAAVVLVATIILIMLLDRQTIYKASLSSLFAHCGSSYVNKQCTRSGLKTAVKRASDSDKNWTLRTLEKKVKTAEGLF